MSDPDWSRLPSLTALRSFEAAARLGGFSAAARGLNVTHAAVAQQVRALEAELRVPLMRREGRGIALTPEGAALAEAVGSGFSTIAEAVERVRVRERSRGLRITCTPSLAQAVLMPRLAEFWRAHPGIAVSIDTDPHWVDLIRDGFDLAIRSVPAGGTDHWPGLDAELLARNRFLLVGAPSLLGQGTPDLERLPWLLATALPNEFEWLRAAGYDPAGLRIIDVENGALAKAAALHGGGLVFASEPVVRDDIAAGRLREVPFPGLPELTYYIVTPAGPRRPAVQAFADWLKTLVRGTTGKDG
jgi:LysR family glycine cleavage system transcriptional activator